MQQPYGGPNNIQNSRVLMFRPGVVFLLTRFLSRFRWAPSDDPDLPGPVDDDVDDDEMKMMTRSYCVRVNA